MSDERVAYIQEVTRTRKYISLIDFGRISGRYEYKKTESRAYHVRNNGGESIHGKRTF